MVVRNSVLLILFALLTVACSPVKTKTTVFPKLSPQCEQQAYKTRHLVRWMDGHVTLLNGPTREDILNSFIEKNLNRLEHIEPDIVVRAPQIQVTTITPRDSNIDNWGAERLHADVAWQAGARGGGITVAVVDTGVDISHSQLVNQIAYNKGEIPNNGVDDDDNGFIDDYAGFDFTADQPLVRDYDRHGTHVSGIIAAAHSDSVAGSADHAQGIAPGARIMPLAFIDSSGSGSLYDAMRAIDYAAANGARVINASWGGAGCSTLLRDQISGLLEKGVVFVNAAGNSSFNIDYDPEYPAAYNLLSQLTIGATGPFNARASFSNYGDQRVHLFAPGVDIISTIPGNGLGMMSGTSMATPMVSGAVAVLLGAFPNLSMEQLRTALYRSAEVDSAYHNASRGRIDLGAALTFLGR